MSDFTPKTPIELQIRKIIFEKFNDVDSRFSNDQIFEIIKEGNDIDPSWIIDDFESFLHLFFYQIKSLNIEIPENCLKIFKSNNILGFLIFINLLLGKIFI